MAVDTENKRVSTVAMGLAFLMIGPLPDGTIDAADRVHTAGFYSGIDVSAAISFDLTPPLTTSVEDMTTNVTVDSMVTLTVVDDMIQTVTVN